MASSRQMRSSTATSLTIAPSEQAQPAYNDDEMSYGHHVLGPEEWQEPTPRAPAPSFEDYKGLERQGVLEHMAPLGSFPSSKVKARIKHYEPPRRTTHMRNGEAKFVSDEVATPEPPSLPISTVDPSLYNTGPSFDLSPHPPYPDHHLGLSPGPHDDLHTPQHFPGDSQAHVLHTLPAQGVPPMSSAPPAPPAPRMQTIGLHDIVQKAIDRFSQEGRGFLGIALQKLYNEAQYDQGHLHLLNAILSNNHSQEQGARFQTFIKSARRQAKKGQRSTNPSSSALPTPQQEKMSQITSTRQTAPSGIGSETESSSHNFQNPLPATPFDTPSKTSKSSTRRRMENGTSSKRESRSTKRKRSGSASSDSSLSSFTADIEALRPDDLSGAGTRSSVSRTGNFRGGSHSRRGKTSKTNHIPTDDNTVETRVAARKRLDYGLNNVQVAESALRTSVSPRRNRSASSTANRQRSQQPRSNGATPKFVTDQDDSDSPLSSHDELPPPPSYAGRGVTPQLGRPPKASKKAVRIKQSPLKKRSGVTAGLALPAESESHHLSYGRSEDNNVEPDVCSACSGNGSLLLCDGCPRGFHFTCCDPPLHPATKKEELPEQWYCRRCSNFATANDNVDDRHSLWTELNRTLQSRNPTAFRLPRDIRDYFEGVITGEEGEYEEVHNVKIAKARPGYDEIPDNLKLRDRKDNTILCYKCGGSSNGKREIASCDYCSLSWHLDCLNPPLASAPNKKAANGKPRTAWMCPNHSDHAILHVKAAKSGIGKSSLRESSSAQPEETVRVFKTRRPKQAIAVEIGLKRGFRNNGLIEIDEDDSEEDSEVEKEISGVIYRVPERGIKLDFIDRIRQLSSEAQNHSQRLILRKRKDHVKQVSLTGHSKPMENDEFSDRPFRERKAALNLIQLAKQTLGDGADRVSSLIQTLTAEAPSEVERLFKPETAKPPLSNSQEHEDIAVAIKGLPLDQQQELKDLKEIIARAQRRERELLSAE